MAEKQYRTCVRMSEKEYQMLRRKSRDAGLSMNQYLLRQLRENPPQCYRKDEIHELVEELNQSGRIINGIARDFNSSCGTENQLEEVKARLQAAISRVHAVREMGYPYAV